jgi:hypothetical protein
MMTLLLAPIAGTPFLGGNRPGFVIVDADGLQQLLRRTSAERDPTVTDDVAAGYAPGAWWQNTANGRLWYCRSAAPTAADWLELGGPPGGNAGAVQYRDADGRLAGGSLTWTEATACLAAGEAYLILADALQLGAADGIDCGQTVYFGSGELTHTPTGTAAIIDLGAKNHQSLDCGSASGDLAVTLTVPVGPTAGTLLVQQRGTARDLTWTPSSGTIKWLGVEPAWTNDAGKYRLVHWRWTGSILFLGGTGTADV